MITVIVTIIVTIPKEKIMNFDTFTVIVRLTLRGKSNSNSNNKYDKLYNCK